MNNSYKKTILLFFLVFCFFLTKADFVLALEQQYPMIFGMGIGSGTLPEYAKYFFNIGMALAGILAVVVMVFGGAYYLVSLGMGKFTDEGKQWIKAGVLGLILTVCSYLIAYTINPDLVIFKLDGLLSISFNGGQDSTTNTTPFLYYNEIPIGTLTENLLSRTMDCYEFDANGDPIEGEIKTDDGRTINGPTLLNHDRVDCFLKLTEAAEKKAKLFKKLSDEIVKLMETCVCEGKCDTACGAGGCTIQGSSCTGSCIGGACKPFEGKSNDCCPSDSGIRKPGTNSNFTVKEVIEYGPIKLDPYIPEKCDYSEKKFRGLEEFRTGLTDVSTVIEINPKPVVDDREITVIDNGNCQICDNYNSNCQSSRASCLENSPWNKLKLIEQLTYLKEKIEQIKLAIERDNNQLKSAENKLGQCYLAEPYVDFLKTVEKTKKEEKTIIVQKTFNDPETQDLIDVYKYCKGFEYAKSDFYSKCQNICPEKIDQNLSCYQQCDKNDSACIKNCYNNRLCPAYTPKSANPSSRAVTFMDCINGLREECIDSCNKKYSCDRKELDKCKESCTEDSTCLLENEEECIVNFQKLKSCSEGSSSSDNLENCVDSSFLCKYGSDEYAGYPDCTTSNQLKYSSSYLFQNPSTQRCRYPYRLYPGSREICLNFYPETAKCPTASKCPTCPCGIIDEQINYDSGERDSSKNDDGNNTTCPSGECLGADGICSPGNCEDGDSGSDGGSSSGGGSGGNNGSDSSNIESILEYQAIIGTCNDSNFNDDPLTFYCQKDWWYKENKMEEKKPEPIGKEKVCLKEGEIPVGQTVDDTETWASTLLENTEKFITSVNDLIQYINGIGSERNYCKCDSVCDGGLPCSSDCTYVESMCSEDGTCTDPKCVVDPCAGISCQKIINLLRGGSSKSCPRKEYGIFYYYDKIYKGSKDFYKFFLTSNRSDVLKELSYSRKKMDEGSTVQSAFGKEAKILSCERVQDEIISPIKEGKTRIEGDSIKSYCYGKDLGKIMATPFPLADNWFYCEERQGINE